MPIVPVNDLNTAGQSCTIVSANLALIYTSSAKMTATITFPGYFTTRDATYTTLNPNPLPHQPTLACRNKHSAFMTSPQTSTPVVVMDPPK